MCGIERGRRRRTQTPCRGLVTKHQTSACVALTLVLDLARPAAAHPLDLGYLRLSADGDAVTAVLDLHVHAAARLLGTAPAALDTGALAARADALADATMRGAPIVTPAGPCLLYTSDAADER